MTLLPVACQFCAAPVRSAQEGIVFRAGHMTIVLCTKHARLAQASLEILGQATLRGIGRVLEEQHPGAARALRAAHTMGAALNDEVVGTVRKVTVQARRARDDNRRRPVYEDVIDGEFVEVKP